MEYDFLLSSIYPSNAHHYSSRNRVSFQKHFPWLFPKHLDLFSRFLRLCFLLVLANYDVHQCRLFILDIQEGINLERLNQESEAAKKLTRTWYQSIWKDGVKHYHCLSCCVWRCTILSKPHILHVRIFQSWHLIFMYTLPVTATVLLPSSSKR